MPRVLTLAHLSDVHLPPMPPLGLRHANLKRVLGFLNWHRRRRHQHVAATLARIVGDLQQQAPDHVAVTGDLVNIGLPAEYEAARRWLEALGTPASLSIVPGNHDIYTHLGADPGVGRWQPWMQGIGDGPGGGSEAAGGTGAAAVAGPGFPFVRRLGAIALVGLNSAVPTAPFQATGRLGRDQLERLDRVLLRLGREGSVRVVLIHHPPLPGLAGRRCALEDAAELAGVLSKRGAELVLHGHNHRAMATLFEAGGRPLPVVGVPSASLALTHGSQTLAGYNLYRIAPERGAPIEMISRGIEHADGPVVETGRRRLDAGGMPAA